MSESKEQTQLMNCVVLQGDIYSPKLRFLSLQTEYLQAMFGRFDSTPLLTAEVLHIWGCGDAVLASTAGRSNYQARNHYQLFVWSPVANYC